MRLSVIGPVYNEELTIGQMSTDLAVDIGDIQKEIIIANDGSDDGTQEAINESPWRGDGGCRSTTRRSPGQGRAIRLGSSSNRGRILIQDADWSSTQEYGPARADCRRDART